MHERQGISPGDPAVVGQTNHFPQCMQPYSNWQIGGPATRRKPMYKRAGATMPGYSLTLELEVNRKIGGVITLLKMVDWLENNFSDGLATTHFVLSE